MNNLLFHYALSYILVGITLGAIALFVYFQDRKNPLYRTFALYNLSIAWWCFFSLPAILQHNSNIAVYWCRTFILGAIFIPTIFFHFTLLFLGIIDKYERILKISYVFSFVFFLFDFTPLFIQAAEPKITLRNYTIAGFIFNIHVIHFFIMMFFGEILLLKRYLREQHTIQGKRILYYLSTGLLATIGGGANYLPVYKMEITPLNPFGTYLLVIYGITVAYIILRYGFLEIQIIIKKTLIFAGLFTTAYAIFALFTILGQTFLEDVIRWNRWFAIIPSIFVIVLALRPLENFLISVTDKYLFQKKYEYKQIIQTFIDEVITELNLDQVVNSTLKLLDQTLHPYTSAIFILNKVEDKYQLYNAYGLKDKNISFTSDSKLVTFLKTTKEPAVIRQINGIAGVNPEVASELSGLKAVIALPLLLHNDLIGFICLGKKKSDEDYTKDDLDILQDLARTESIAVGNAQLLAEAAQAERRAAIGTMAAGIHHEIGNPLNIMATKIQLFKLGRQKGLFQDKSNEEMLNQVESTLDECLKQSERISEITRKLSNFAKPSKEFKPEPVSIPVETDEVLAIFGHEFELEKIKIEKRFPQDLPKILADRREIQQIFFNIIRNAAQAIEEKGIVTISAVATSNNRVHIEIQDTGKGIPEDKIQRIFEPFFTTKGSNKGTGLGLSIVRQLVWRNKGEISFRSQRGIGTTFILEFPQGELVS